MGGGTVEPITVTVETQCSSNIGSYGMFTLNNTHKFKKLTVNSYNNIGSAAANYPYIKVDGTQYNRPSVGTEFDIQQKEIYIVPFTYTGNYTKVGITITLS